MEPLNKKIATMPATQVSHGKAGAALRFARAAVFSASIITGCAGIGDTLRPEHLEKAKNLLEQYNPDKKVRYLPTDFADLKPNNYIKNGALTIALLGFEIAENSTRLAIFEISHNKTGEHRTMMVAEGRAEHLKIGDETVKLTYTHHETGPNYFGFKAQAGYESYEKAWKHVHKEGVALVTFAVGYDVSAIRGI